jgi:hypothetical protein
MAETERAAEDAYLGDGVYASFDGYQIILQTPREDGTHWLSLEPPVLAELIFYAQRIGMLPRPGEAAP